MGPCQFQPSIIVFLLVGLFALRNNVQAAASSGTPTVVTERHVILHGCKETKQSPYWSRIRDTLVNGIDFDTVTCVASDEDERQATLAILQRHAAVVEEAAARATPTTTTTTVAADFHVVAAILTRNHCEPQAVTCRQVNRGENYIPLLRAGIRGWFIETEPDFEGLGGKLCGRALWLG